MMKQEFENLWNLDSESELIRESANQVYKAKLDSQEIYLRLTFPEHRSEVEIQAEIDWMLSLHASGLAVVRPIPSARGAYVERTQQTERECFAVAFEAAPGRQAKKPHDYSPDVVKSWAQLLAKFHKHSESFRPNPNFQRPDWQRDRVFELAQKGAQPALEIEQIKFIELRDWMNSLPRDSSVFGLTHADLHLGNLSVANGEVTAFDFDDACYHWFIHDLAVALTSIRKANWEFPGAFDCEQIEQTFLESYVANANLSTEWMNRLEAFVQYRVALSACWALQAQRENILEATMIEWYKNSLPWWRSQLTRI